MGKTWRLKRTIQCTNCPFKCSSDLAKIPKYNADKHESLKRTIADETTPFFVKQLRVMACHHSTDSNEQHCVGWLHNQLGDGNNIALRLQVRHCENIDDLRIIGEQHNRFEDTFKNIE